MWIERIRYWWSGRRLVSSTLKLVREAKKTGTTDAARALMQLSLFDSHSSVARWSGALALGELADERDLDSLIRALGDGDLRVCIEAARAIGKIGSFRGAEALNAIFEDESRHPLLRSTAGDVLIAMAKKAQQH